MSENLEKSQRRVNFCETFSSSFFFFYLIIELLHCQRVKLLHDTRKNVKRSSARG